jgi:hypothetical protein
VPSNTLASMDEFSVNESLRPGDRIKIVVQA